MHEVFKEYGKTKEANQQIEYEVSFLLDSMNYEIHQQYQQSKGVDYPFVPKKAQEIAKDIVDRCKDIRAEENESILFKEKVCRAEVDPRLIRDIEEEVRKSKNIDMYLFINIALYEALQKLKKGKM